MAKDNTVDTGIWLILAAILVIPLFGIMAFKGDTIDTQSPFLQKIFDAIWNTGSNIFGLNLTPDSSSSDGSGSVDSAAPVADHQTNWALQQYVQGNIGPYADGNIYGPAIAGMYADDGQGS